MIGFGGVWESGRVLELSSGLTTSRLTLSDGRVYWSAQPLWLPVGAGVGGGVGLVAAIPAQSIETIPGGLAIGWLAAQIATNSQMRIGWKYFSFVGAQQVDWLVPGWHPREKLSLGVQVGNSVALRAAGFRSLSMIEELDGYGVELRLVGSWLVN